VLEVDGLLIDVDGVLRVDDAVISGAPEAIAAMRGAGFRLHFLTNTSTRSHVSLHRNLTGLGLPIEESELFTAPVATAKYLRESGKRRIFLLVKGDVASDFAEFERADDCVDAVVIGGAEEGFTYANINRAFQLVLDGAELVAIHRNTYWQTASGLQIDAGAYVAGLEYATGASATLVGKPSSTFFALALADLGLPAERVLVVGDDVDADVGGGQEVGAHTALVRTGKFRPRDLERAAHRPDLVLDSIGDLPDCISRKTPP
jgi:HAD superfamily hydrolase (TIGR01458 family)